MTEYLVSDEMLATIRSTCYEAGKAGKEIFSVKSPSVEIVRCGECEQYFEAWGTCMRDSYVATFYEGDGGAYESVEGMFDTEPDDFCAWGERRRS